MKKRTVCELTVTIRDIAKCLETRRSGKKEVDELIRLLRETAIQLETLKRQRDRAKRALIRMEEICALCRHRRELHDPACEKNDGDCTACAEECPCGACEKGSEFEWE